MSPRRSTFKPAPRHRGDVLVLGLAIAVGVEVLAYLIVGILLAQYVAEGRAL